MSVSGLLVDGTMKSAMMKTKGICICLTRGIKEQKQQQGGRLTLRYLGLPIYLSEELGHSS